MKKYARKRRYHTPKHELLVSTSDLDPGSKEYQRRKTRIDKYLEERRIQEEWMNRCVNIPVPTIQRQVVFCTFHPHDRLDFGIMDFIEYAKAMFVQHEDENAAATLRLLIPWNGHKDNGR